MKKKKAPRHKADAIFRALEKAGYEVVAYQETTVSTSFRERNGFTLTAIPSPRKKG
jgi:hypothetical protein